MPDGVPDVHEGVPCMADGVPGVLDAMLAENPHKQEQLQHVRFPNEL